MFGNPMATEFYSELERAPMFDDPEELGDPAPDVDDWSVIELPVPNPWIVYNAPGVFHFDWARVSASFTGVPPQLLEGFMGNRKYVDELRAIIHAEHALPMPIHSSPILALFMKPKDGSTDNLIRPSVTIWQKSMLQLMILKEMCIHGVLPFHQSITVEDVQRHHEDWVRNVDQARAQHQRLPTLETAFVQELEHFSYKCIHLLEYFLHACLVAPHGIPLEAVLTPVLDAAECPFNVEPAVREFFEIKNNLLQSKMREYGFEEENKHLFDFSQVSSKDALWKGYLPKSIVQQYMQLLLSD